MEQIKESKEKRSATQHISYKNQQAQTILSRIATASSLA